MSARKQLLMDQGATFETGFTVLDDSSGECLPMDLAGWSARMQVRETHASETTLLDLDSGSLGGITIIAADGRVQITATAAQTAALPAPSVLVYDVEGEQASTGKVKRWLSGFVRVSPEVTR